MNVTKNGLSIPLKTTLPEVQKYIYKLPGHHKYTVFPFNLILNTIKNVA